MPLPRWTDDSFYLNYRRDVPVDCRPDLLPPEPGTSLEAISDINMSIGQEAVTYNTTDGINVVTGGKITYGSPTQEKSFNSQYQLPIVAGDGITIAPNTAGDKVEVKSLVTTLNNQTYQIGVVTELPSAPSENTIYFVTEA